jgi:hypothetical protein
MNTQLIRDRLNSETTACTLRLSDGTRVRIEHPDFAAVTPGLIVVVGKDYSITKIDPLHVVAIEDGPQKKSKANGRRSR